MPARVHTKAHNGSARAKPDTDERESVNTAEPVPIKVRRTRESARRSALLCPALASRPTARRQALTATLPSCRFHAYGKAHQKTPGRAPSSVLFRPQRHLPLRSRRRSRSRRDACASSLYRALFSFRKQKAENHVRTTRLAAPPVRPSDRPKHPIKKRRPARKKAPGDAGTLFNRK